MRTTLVSVSERDGDVREVLFTNFQLNDEKILLKWKRVEIKLKKKKPMGDWVKWENLLKTSACWQMAVYKCYKI